MISLLVGMLCCAMDSCELVQLSAGYSQVLCLWRLYIPTMPRTSISLVPCHAGASALQQCASGTLVALYPQEALTHSAAQAFCKAQLGAAATLVPGANTVVLAAARELVAKAGLSPPGEPLWSAAAWVGITRDSTGKWGDASGPLSGLPWCPSEPNNNFKDGTESCSNLLTGCSSSGAALLNDFACDKLARVLCALPDASECGESWPRAPASCHISMCCSQLVLVSPPHQHTWCLGCICVSCLLQLHTIVPAASHVLACQRHAQVSHKLMPLPGHEGAHNMTCTSACCLMRDARQSAT